MINEKKDACYHKVKSRYSVWPSAYASGALVKCRKKGAKNWGNSRKDEALHTAYFNFAVSLLEGMVGPDGKGISSKKVKKAEETVKAKKTGNSKPKTQDSPSPDVTTTIKKYKNDDAPTTPQAGIGGKSTSVAAGDRSGGEGPQPERRKQSRQSAEDIEKLKRGIYRGQYKRRVIGYENDPKTGKRVPKYELRRTALARAAIEREKDSILDIPGAAARGFQSGRQKAKRQRIDFSTEYQRIGSIIAEKSAAWTRSEGKNPSGGLNAKGVASYRAQNPGSKLKTAVTTKPSKLKKGSKAANRRKSFCARMKGMRKRQKSSNNTGKDRLSLSLKKWNC